MQIAVAANLSLRDIECSGSMAHIVIAAVLGVTSIASAAPIASSPGSSCVPMLNMLISRPSHQEHSPLDAPIQPKHFGKYEKFANNALYLGFNTIKIGFGLGMFTLVLTVTERLARWLYRHVRGSIAYWKDEIRDLKHGGMDPDQSIWDRDEFVNEPDGWESPYIKRKNRTTFMQKTHDPRLVKWILD